MNTSSILKGVKCSPTPFKLFKMTLVCKPKVPDTRVLEIQDNEISSYPRLFKISFLTWSSYVTQHEEKRTSIRSFLHPSFEIGKRVIPRTDFRLWNYFTLYKKFQCWCPYTSIYSILYFPRSIDMSNYVKRTTQSVSILCYLVVRESWK